MPSLVHIAKSAAIVSLCLAAAGACASRPRGGPPQGAGPGRGEAFEGKVARPVGLLFVKFDANGDNILTPEELAAGAAAQWPLADRDASGAISGFEMADWCASVLGDPEAAPGRLSLDADMNGSVTPEEWDAGLRKEFRMADRNADGAVTRDELLIQIQPRGTGSAGSGGGEQGRPPGGGRGPGGGRRPPG
jgi:hypothetical protein